MMMNNDMPKHELDSKAHELVDLKVCFSIVEARRIILSGINKFEKYKAIGLKRKQEQSQLELNPTPTPKNKHTQKEVTIWPCPKCSPATLNTDKTNTKITTPGMLIKRTNSKSKESFLGCTNFPACKYTQKIEPQESLGIKDAAEVWE